MTGESEYLRARDIARLSGVSIRTARRWIAKRILASGKIAVPAISQSRLTAETKSLRRVPVKSGQVEEIQHVRKRADRVLLSFTGYLSFGALRPG